MPSRLRIAYCEDEPIQIEYVKSLAQSYGISRHTEIEFCGFLSAEAFLFEHPDTYAYSVIFLDIDMKGLSGMELAKIIRQKDVHVPIVFLTNEKDYVFEGYEVKALRYLMKPMDAEKMAVILEGLAKKDEQEPYYIIDRQDRETVKIDLQTVRYFEVRGHYLNVCCKEQCYIIKKSLQDIVRQLETDFSSLSEAGFVLTHRSYLAALPHMDKITRTECIMDGGEVVPVSRNEYKNVNAAFLEYYRTRM